MNANGGDGGGGAPRWGPLVRPFRLASAALTDPAPRLVTAFVRAEDVRWLEPELEVLEFSPFGTLQERVPEPTAPEEPPRTAPGTRPPARRARKAAPARSAAAAAGRAPSPPVFSFRRRAAGAAAEQQQQPQQKQQPEAEAARAHDGQAARAVPQADREAPLRAAAAPARALAGAPEPESEPEASDARVEPLALLEQLVDPLYARRRASSRGPTATRRAQQRRRAPAAGPPALRSGAVPARDVSALRSGAVSVRDVSALRSTDVAVAGGAPTGPGASASSARRMRVLFPRVPSARAAAAAPPPAGEAPPAAAEPALMRLVEAFARDTPFAPGGAPVAGAVPGRPAAATPPPAAPSPGGATGPGAVEAGGREPGPGPAPASTLLPLDLGESAPRPPRPPDGAELATLVNDALVEQARRHGVDLS